MTEKELLVQEFQATAEIYGRNLSKMAADILIRGFSAFDPKQILAALGRCRMELRTFPTMADIVARIDDGRPGIEEAWAMIPKDEEGSVVWTEEMALAFGDCRALIYSDQVAARMAFKESYSRRVVESRGAGRRPQWMLSPGWEKSGREAALRDAVDRKRISIEEATLMLPHFEMTPQSGKKSLPRGTADMVHIGEIVEHIKQDMSS